jgi:hypothetical protein
MLFVGLVIVMVLFFAVLDRFVKVDVEQPNHKIDMLPYIIATPDSILSYLKSGQVTLTITLGSTNGTMVDVSIVKLLHSLDGKVSTTIQACMSISAQAQESI